MANRDDQQHSSDLSTPLAEVDLAVPAADVDENLTTSLEDVKQLGLFAAIASLSYVFWVVGGMEMVERLAFYGVKAVAALYATASKDEGGLGVTADKFAIVLTAWAFVQSIFPVFTGGLSDRYGYKETIFASTVIKILGYLIMGFFPRSWEGFFAGAVVLALGTAIFKPGIQGTLVKATNRKNSSMAWGIFYQTVNIGGWMGPLLAAYLHSHFKWTHVFFACAGIISFNFLLLLTYREVGKAERIAATQARHDRGREPSLFADSLREIAKPHVFIYLAIFSGFWFMFMALFDVLPMHIRDWVDTTDVARALLGTNGTPNPIVGFLVGATANGKQINPEGMLNLNAGMIMITCFLFAALSAKLRATTSMVIGTLLASLAMFLCGYATMGWMSLGAIAIFSMGEMLSSPKFSEFIGNFAPADKKAMYLGFSQLPIALGWTLEGYIGPTAYHHFASKDHLVREFLVQRMQAGQAVLPAPETFTAWSQVADVKTSAEQLTNLFTTAPQEFIDKIPVGEAFKWATQITSDSPMMQVGLPQAHDVAAQITAYLHNTYQVGNLWYIMVAVGLVSALGIYIYGRWIRTLKKA